MSTKTEVIVIHAKIDRSWYDGLSTLADENEGSVHSQVKIAIRERLERANLLKRPCVARAVAQ
ncbi:MAG: hypothetical protein J6N18_03830 [Kiritimatiellae bacterium]|nr:hypothetical protein [Kiritimatiellia bacterium]